MAERGGEEQARGARISTLDVFISYASPNSTVSDAVCEALERAGVTCWIAPRDVTPGAPYAGQIIHAIDAAKAIVLILSQNAASSPHVLREVERASSKRHPIISLRLDQAPLPADFEYFLNTSHWLDASGGNIARSLPKLITAVRIAIEAPSLTQEVVPPPQAPARPSARSSKRMAIVIASLLGLIIAGLAVDRLWIPSRKVVPTSLPVATLPTPVAAPVAAPIPEKSVAVLPFVDMSEKKDQEYFSDGLSEELIDHLAQSADLKVIARTSSFQFKGKSEDVRIIGQRLGVANLLEGSVRTSGKTMRVTAQLVRVSDGSHLWSDSYDRERGDIFKVQDSIAVAVVTALRTTLGKSTSSPDKSANIEAYNALLRARYFYNKQTIKDVKLAIAELEEAIRLEPRYAVAWVEIASAYNSLGTGGAIPPNQAYAEARKAVDQALAIDPNLATAHEMLGSLEWNYNRDFEAAEVAYSRARDLDPNSARVFRHEGFKALAYGQFDKAIRTFQRLLEIDPLDSWVRWMLDFGLFAADRLPEAERVARDSLYLDLGNQSDLGEVLLAEHKPDAALAVMREEPDQDERWRIADVFWVIGRRSEADALLAEAISKFASSRAYWFARSYALRNDKDEAFKWLYRANDNREPFITLMKADPLLRNLRGDPRFTALLRKLKLPA